MQGIQIDLDKKTAGWWFNHSCTSLTQCIIWRWGRGKGQILIFSVKGGWDIVLSLVKLLLQAISHLSVVEADANVVEVILEDVTVLLLEQTINYVCIWICSDRCPTNCPRFLVSCLPLHLPYLHQILQRPPVLHQLLPLQAMFKLVPTWRRKILDAIKLIPYLCICHMWICHTCIRFHPSLRINQLHCSWDERSHKACWGCVGKVQVKKDLDNCIFFLPSYYLYDHIVWHPINVIGFLSGCFHPRFN